jgi:hypothetical protein
MLCQGGGEKNTHTLRYVDMCKWQRVIPMNKGSPRYWIAHVWKDEFGSFNLETLKLLMHFREPGSSLFISYILIFFSFLFLIHIFSLFLFFSFSFLLFSFSFSSKFFICSHLNSKIAFYLPPPPCLDVCSSSGKEVIEIR